MASIADIISVGGDITLRCLPSPRGILIHCRPKVARNSGDRIVESSRATAKGDKVAMQFFGKQVDEGDNAEMTAFLGP